MLSNDVDGEGYSSFRSGLMVVYYTALPVIFCCSI